MHALNSASSAPSAASTLPLSSMIGSAVHNSGQAFREPTTATELRVKTSVTTAARCTTEPQAVTDLTAVPAVLRNGRSGSAKHGSKLACDGKAGSELFTHKATEALSPLALTYCWTCGL